MLSCSLILWFWRKSTAPPLVGFFRILLASIWYYAFLFIDIALLVLAKVHVAISGGFLLNLFGLNLILCFPLHWSLIIDSILPGHQSHLSDYIKLILPTYELWKKTKKTIWKILLDVLCHSLYLLLQRNGALKSHGLVEAGLQRKRPLNGSHWTLVYVFACHF